MPCRHAHLAPRCISCLQSSYECSGGTCSIVCFPGSATVETLDRGTVRMFDLKNGDSVLSVDWSGQLVYKVRACCVRAVQRF